VEQVTEYIRRQTSAEYDEEMIEEMEKNALAAGQKKRGAAAALAEEDGDGERDGMFADAVRVVAEAGEASTTMLQSRLKLGYARARRIMDALEESGIVGPSEGAKPRKVFITRQQYMEMHALGDDDFARAVSETADTPPFDMDDDD